VCLDNIYFTSLPYETTAYKWFRVTSVPNFFICPIRKTTRSFTFSLTYQATSSKIRLFKNPNIFYLSGFHAFLNLEVAQSYYKNVFPDSNSAFLPIGELILIEVKVTDPICHGTDMAYPVCVYRQMELIKPIPSTKKI